MCHRHTLGAVADQVSVTREYFMPTCPIAIPSQTAIAGNTTGCLQPSRTPSLTASVILSSSYVRARFRYRSLRYRSAVCSFPPLSFPVHSSNFSAVPAGRLLLHYHFSFVRSSHSIVKNQIRSASRSPILLHPTNVQPYGHEYLRCDSPLPEPCEPLLPLLLPLYPDQRCNAASWQRSAQLQWDLRDLCPRYPAHCRDWAHISRTFVSFKLAEDSIPIEPVTMLASSEKNIAKHIFGQDHIELRRIFDQLHRTVVHKHMRQLHVRIILCHLFHHASPQSRGIQHVCLVHARHFAFFSCALHQMP